MRYVVEFNFGSIHQIGTTMQMNLKFLKKKYNITNFNSEQDTKQILFDMFFFSIWLSTLSI